MPALKGLGLLKGLGVTFGTMTRRAATRQYPHARPELPARTRGVIALVDENCTVCMLCARECPDWCIYIDSHKEVVAPKEGGRARTRNVLDRFAIDFALCMYCGICVEVCPFDALFWSPEFEYASDVHESLTHEMPRLREWAYTVPAPDPLDPGAVPAKEIEAALAPPKPTPAPAPVVPAVQAPEAGPPVEPATTVTEAAADRPEEVAAPAAAHAPGAIDQEVFDRLIAAGEPERTARAKAKAAFMRRQRAAAAGPSSPETPPPPAEAAPAVPVQPDAPAAHATGIDQEVFDRLIAAGEPERTARAKAKAAWARAERARQREPGA